MQVKDDSIVKSVDELIKWQIIERRNAVINVFEEAYSRSAGRSRMPYGVLQSKVKSLFLQIRAMLKRSITKKDLDELESQINSTSLEELESGFNSIEEFLDQKGISRADFGQQIQGRTAERTNVNKNL